MNYDLYKFYKGEAECPPSLDNEQGRLWNVERVFDREFSENDSSDWYAFFKDREINGKNAGEIFMNKIDDEECERPKATSKGWIFNLWKEAYLFVDKFSQEWFEIYKKGL